MLRMLYFVSGLFFVGLAFIGAFLPVMPSTIFVILAAGCFARSSPRFETWLLDHKHFGPSLKAWRQHGAILPGAKAMALAGMLAGYLIFWFVVEPAPLLAIGVASLLISSAVYVATRPSGPQP